jgi:hypothetical protein
MLKILLARLGLGAPPYTALALDVQTQLVALEDHLAETKDARGMALCRNLHRALERCVEEAPAGTIDVQPLSGGLPKPGRG